jgi:hypothetical protein
MCFDKVGKFSAITNGKSLYQELLVNMYICVERSRLDFIRQNQKKLKADLYKSVEESIHDESDFQGQGVILPSTFAGSPQNMAQLYQDAMALSREFGRPALFITMTANPKWAEVTVALPTHQVASDRPDLIARIFYPKFNALLDDIVKGQIFGRVVSLVYTIEFQKRGLPHARIMVILDSCDVPNSIDAVDSMISAKIPSPTEEPDMYEIVTRNMLHGPCRIKSNC